MRGIRDSRVEHSKLKGYLQRLPDRRGVTIYRRSCCNCGNILSQKDSSIKTFTNTLVQRRVPWKLHHLMMLSVRTEMATKKIRTEDTRGSIDSEVTGVQNLHIGKICCDMLFTGSCVIAETLMNV